MPVNSQFSFSCPRCGEHETDDLKEILAHLKGRDRCVSIFVSASKKDVANNFAMYFLEYVKIRCNLKHRVIKQSENGTKYGFHHDDDGNAVYSCLDCDATSNRQDTCKTHIEKHCKLRAIPTTHTLSIQTDPVEIVIPAPVELPKIEIISYSSISDEHSHIHDIVTKKTLDEQEDMLKGDFIGNMVRAVYLDAPQHRRFYAEYSNKQHLLGFNANEWIKIGVEDFVNKVAEHCIQIACDLVKSNDRLNKEVGGKVRLAYNKHEECFGCEIGDSEFLDDKNHIALHIKMRNEYIIHVIGALDLDKQMIRDNYRRVYDKSVPTELLLVS